MKIVNLITLLVAVLPLTSFAREGGVAGGGGSEIVAEFVTQAGRLIKRLESSRPDVEEITVVKELLAGEQLQILIVTALTDSKTGLEIEHQDGLIAWGEPGRIQLKASEWNEAFFKKFKNMDHHIFHELCRAAAPKCNDEAYRISIGQLNLVPSRFGYKSKTEIDDQVIIFEPTLLTSEGPIPIHGEVLLGKNSRICQFFGYQAVVGDPHTEDFRSGRIAYYRFPEDSSDPEGWVVTEAQKVPDDQVDLYRIKIISCKYPL